MSNRAENIDDVTETMDFSSTLDTIAPLRLRKIKEMSPTPWYNEHTRALKSSLENGAQLEENKTRGISYGLVGKYHILQKSIKNS